MNSIYNWLFKSLCLFAVVSFLKVVGANIFLGLSTLLFLAFLAKNREYSIAEDKVPFCKAIMVFTVALLISALFSGHIGSGLKVWSEYFLWRFMPFLIVITLFDERLKAEKLLGAVFCGFVIDCLYAIYWSFFVFKGKFDWIRAAGFVGHPMTLAGWACILLPILLVYMFRNDIFKKRKSLVYFVFIVGVIALLFNATRGAWLALAIVLPLMIVLLIGNNKKLVMICMTIVLVAGVVLVNNASFMKRINSITDTKNVSNASRFVIWDASLSMFKEHSILGVGLGQYKFVYRNDYMNPKLEEQRVILKKLNSFQKLKKTEQDAVLKSPVNLWKLQGFKKLTKQEKNELVKAYKDFRFAHSLIELTHAHNNIIQMLAENGIIGCMGYLFAFGYILWSNIKNYFANKNPYALMIVGSTGALLLQGLTEYNFGNGAVMKIYWLVLACLLVLASNYNKEESNKVN